MAPEHFNDPDDPDIALESRGFISSSFSQGMTPAEMVQHQAAGWRERSDDRSYYSRIRLPITCLPKAQKIFLHVLMVLSNILMGMLSFLSCTEVMSYLYV